MRIVSLLPAATELACALGLQEQLVGISFECNYPAEITHLPRVVDTTLPTHGMAPADIDIAVSKKMREGGSLYAIDETLLAKLKPDLILTQDLCQVCAPSGNELSQALKALDYAPQVMFMTPHTLADIQSNLHELAQITGREKEAEKIIVDWNNRINKVRAQIKDTPRVFVMEWVEPIYCSGHWLAEMIDIAGGNDTFARKGADSMRVAWEDVRDWQPEILLIAPCGYNETQAAAQIPLLEKLPGWNDIPAVKNGHVYAVDADAYFVRPGPRLVEGLEMMRELFSRHSRKDEAT